MNDQTIRHTVRHPREHIEAIEEAIENGELNYAHLSAFIREATAEKTEREMPHTSGSSSNDTHWKEQTSCQTCNAPKRTISGDNPEGAKPLRAITLRSGRTDLLCQSCFEAALADDRVSPTDSRVDTA